MNLSGRKVWAHTLGCRINQYDTDAMLELLYGLGCVPAQRHDEADILLVNTCTVTAEADRKSRQLIRKAAAEGKILIVAGCLAQRSAQELAKNPGVRHRDQGQAGAFTAAGGIRSLRAYVRGG